MPFAGGSPRRWSRTAGDPVQRVALLHDVGRLGRVGVGVAADRRRGVAVGLGSRRRRWLGRWAPRTAWLGAASATGERSPASRSSRLRAAATARSRRPRRIAARGQRPSRQRRRRRHASGAAARAGRSARSRMPRQARVSRLEDQAGADEAIARRRRGESGGSRGRRCAPEREIALAPRREALGQAELRLACAVERRRADVRRGSGARGRPRRSPCGRSPARARSRADPIHRLERKSRADVRRQRGNEISRRRPIFPGGCPPSIFGAGELNFRVRDGNGWCLSASVTGIDLQLCDLAPVSGEANRRLEASIRLGSVSAGVRTRSSSVLDA